MSAERAFSTLTEAVAAPARMLRALPQRSTRPTLPVIATVSVVVVVALQLLISVVLANGAYEVKALEQQQANDIRTQTAVTQDLVSVQSPQYIANNAGSLGMVANSNTVYLRLSDARVFGSPTPATGRTLAGANVSNSLLDGIPLASQLQAQRDAAVKASSLKPADSIAGGAGSGAVVAPGSANSGTPNQVAGQNPAASVPLPSTGIPTLQTH